MDLDRWRSDASARTFRHRSHAIFYRVGGEGPTVLAIHGFPSASWDWHALWPELTRRFRVIAADMIGFGWSDKPRDYDYSILDQASLQEALCREVGAERVHVLAHDYGDTVTQELLARQLSGEGVRAGLTIESVCLLNGGLFPEAHHPRPVQRALANRWLGPLVGRAMNRRGFARSMTGIVDDLWRLLRHNDGHRVAHRLIGYMAERRRHRERWVGALTRATVPLRLVDGVADPVSGAHMVARYRQLVPRADVVELRGIGHYPQIEDPAGVLRAFFDFHSLPA
jgi:pimeloyl-ACP methyl ester carboxylesterase